jgi:hypothetical protein
LGVSSPWWEAFTDLKHDRLRNFREATLGNVIAVLAAVYVLLTLRNEALFKGGQVSADVYELFVPKYWTWKGRTFHGIFNWD